MSGFPVNDPTHRFIDGHSVQIVFVRHSTARRYRLTLRRDGVFRCTIPRRGSLCDAEEFVRLHHKWMVERLQARASRPAPPMEWQVGTQVWFRGECVEIHQALDGSALSLGSLRIPCPPNPESNLRMLIERHLRSLAATELPQRTLELARIHGFEVRAVQVRNQRSRWGSCSARRVVSLNWRLIQFPAEIRDYVILHELAHLRFLNHSPQFWAEVARLCPGCDVAERWLKTHGTRLL